MRRKNELHFVCILWIIWKPLYGNHKVPETSLLLLRVNVMDIVTRNGFEKYGFLYKATQTGLVKWLTNHILCYSTTQPQNKEKSRPIWDSGLDHTCLNSVNDTQYINGCTHDGKGNIIDLLKIQTPVYIRFQQPLAYDDSKKLKSLQK